jgi:flagellar biosynthesis/type III secretory pathway chaperone
MSEATNLIQVLENKAKQIEAQINQIIGQHHGLLGLLQGTKEAIIEAKKVVDFVAPNSTADAVLNEAENVVNVIDNVAGN